MTDAPVPPTAEPPVAVSPTSAARRSPRVGQIAMIIGIALFVVSIAVSVFMGIVAAPHVRIGPNGFDANFSSSDPDPTVRALAFGGVAHVFLGGLFGTWAIVQGIVAIATGRGRGFGVIALILGIATPVISLAVYFGIMLANA